MSYTVVTSNTVYPAQGLPFQKIILTSDIVLSWPNSLSGGSVAAGFNFVVPNQNGWKITFPDATAGSLGSDTQFGNNSIYTFDIVDYAGNPLLTLAAGAVINLKLTDISTQAGVWTQLPFLGAYTGIVAFTAASSNNSITIANGNVTNPGGTIDFKLPESISNLNNVANTGLAVIKTTNPLTWETATILGGDNIDIIDGDGIDGNPVINLLPEISNVDSLQVGKFLITGDELSATDLDTDLLFTTSGTGKLGFNGVTIDVDGNISGISTKAWCVFIDEVAGLSSSSNVITIQDKYNVLSVTGAGTGYYTITFNNPMANINYGVTISLGSLGTSLPPNAYNAFWTTRNTTSVIISVVDAGGELVTALPQGVTVTIMSSG
jgi:hypothetical protein